MSLQKLAKKLRHVADVIDSLFIDLDNENPRVARKILSRHIIVKKRKSRYTKKNPHWMQRPENRTRVIALARKMHRARNK